MAKLDDDAAASGFSAFLHDPLAQGAATGLLTLIPARNYPRWLRRSIIWAPMVIVSGGMATLGANPERAQKLSKQLAAAKHPSQGDPTEQSKPGEKSAHTKHVEPKEQPDHASRAEPPGGLRGAVLTMVPTAPIAAALSASMAAAFWADEKIERGLRRMRLPFPRAVMGAAAAAAAWWSVTKDNQRQRSQETARQ